jgi:EmrB/QacA subfamily drug resistance transporter
VLLATIDSSIVNVALPTLVRELHADFPIVQWVVLAYLLVLTTLMLAVGRLADMHGKKIIFTSGFAVFTIGSVMCGLSTGIYALIAFRGLQAVGAAMILALSNAIITEAFPPAERGRALGISGTMVSIGIVVGPTLGGILISSLSWRWIFFVNLPVGVIGVLLAQRYVPSIKPRGNQKFDWKGIGVFVSGLVAFLLSLTWGQRIGFTDGRVIALMGIGLSCAGFFFFIESRTDQPVIQLGLFRNRDLSVGIVTGFLTFVAIAGTTLLMPFFLENMLGYETRQVGFMLAVVPIAMGLVAPLSGAMSDRIGSRPITIAGLLVLAVGYFGLSRMEGSISTGQFLFRFLPIGLGMGIFQSPNNSAIMGSSPSNKLGVISSLLAITRTLGQTTGIAALGALWASRTLVAAGSPSLSGATQAPAAAQLAGLSDTLALVSIFILFALGAALWAFLTERRRPRPVPDLR